jgi:hypothetical protein
MLCIVWQSGAVVPVCFDPTQLHEQGRSAASVRCAPPEPGKRVYAAYRSPDQRLLVLYSDWTVQAIDAAGQTLGRLVRL